MAARVAKHEHEFRIISHSEDWLKVLVMCKACPATEVQAAAKARVERRRATPQEWKARLDNMEHLCCG